MNSEEGNFWFYQDVNQGKECIFEHADPQTMGHSQLWEVVVSQVSGLAVSDSWILQMWKPARASAKDISVAVPAEQGSAPWVDAGIGLCNTSV